MIKEVNEACEKLNRTLGVDVELPNPKKRTLKAAAAGNFLIGAGLMAAGMVLRVRACTLLGVAGVLSSAVLQKESRDKTRES